ncbi:amidohydrolase family protein [Sulfobacillus harzensis]|uniref:Amidohydrolase family protein n=1 Tax=Sulfobacillus harzensis TaxID=2729629 RepID=A0A7Y0L1S8_9FIRM|nr:amidohydrolase family protein [Sulfobacillus harzensis]NMP21713.1 amidohydrolase family protein [Sulfobacillus harzensis]
MSRFLIRGGWVITLDPGYRDGSVMDIVIDGEEISAIGPRLEAPGAEVIDATGMIVIPGLVDTHRHVWESVIRNVGAEWSLTTYLHHLYFNGLGGMLRPEDVYAGNLLGALEALNAGVTTVLDWSMVNSPEHADALIRALDESGIRAVFAYGTPLKGAGAYWSKDSELPHPEDSRRVKERYFSSKDQRLTMGLAIRGPEFSSWETALNDIQLARELDAVCSMHLGFGTWGSVDHSIRRLNERGVLGPDLNFVHSNTLQQDEYKIMVDHHCSVSVTPEIEMLMGHGYPCTGRLTQAGGAPALGVDVVTSISGDLFGQMRAMLMAERARVNNETLAAGHMPDALALSAREILQFATIQGARALRLDHKIGTLSVGKQADLVLVRATDWNLFPVNDPVGAVLTGAGVHNVDSVFVAGQAVKRDGRLVNAARERIFRLAQNTRDYIFSQYGVPQGAEPAQLDI